MMPKRKHFHNAAQKNNMTPTESMVNEEYSGELGDKYPEKNNVKKKRRK